jgi:fucose permease
MASHTSDNERSPLLAGSSVLNASDDEALPHISDKAESTVILKIAATMLSFSTLGLFNSSIGAILPIISRDYAQTDLRVSLLFLAGPIGYIIAAQCSNKIHHLFGQRGIAAVGPILQIIATTSIATRPNFEILLLAFAVQGLGTGLLDGSWCAWAGSMEKANTVSGMLHGSYSVGGAAGPFFVALIVSHQKPWWLWYYVLVRLNQFFIFSVVKINISRSSGRRICPGASASTIGFS